MDVYKEQERVLVNLINNWFDNHATQTDIEAIRDGYNNSELPSHRVASITSELMDLGNTVHWGFHPRHLDGLPIRVIYKRLGLASEAFVK